MAPSADTAAPAAVDWSRPHPLTLVVELGSAVRQVVVALAVVGFDVVELGSLIELALVVGPLGGAIARWFTTRYAVDGDALHFHHGLIWRRRQALPRANIQNVSTTAGVVARLGSVLELHVSDASSNGDITLRFVSRHEAERLTALLRRSLPAGGDPAPTGGDPAGVEPGAGPDPTGPAAPPSSVPVRRPPLVSPGLGRLARAELTTAAVLVPGLAGLVVGLVGSAALAAGAADLAPDGVPTDGWRRWLVLGAVVAAAAGAAVANLVSRLMALGGYQLTADPDRLRIQVGLLTEAWITVRRERIQQLKVQRNLVQRAWGMERVLFETADLDLPSSAGTRYLDPAGRPGGWRRLAVEAMGRLDLDEPDLQPVSRLTRRRTMARLALATPLTLLALVVPGGPAGVAVAAAGATGWLLAGWWYSNRRYSELGWALSADQLLVRSGVFAGQLRLVDLDKVQSARLSASVFQRRLGLTSFLVATAGRGFAGLVELPDLPRAEAEALLARVAGRAALTPISDTL